MFNRIQQWLLKIISTRFSSVSIIMVLGFLCYYFDISAATLFSWYKGDVHKLVSVICVGTLVALYISADLIMTKLRDIYNKVEYHDNVFSEASGINKDNQSKIKVIIEKIDSIIQELGNTSKVVIILIQQSIYLTRPSIDIVASQYIDHAEPLNELEKQALYKHVDNEKIKFIQTMSYFVTRFFDSNLRTTMFNSMIKVAIDKGFERCYNNLALLLSKPNLDYATKLAEIRKIEDQLVQDLLKGVLNIDYDMIDPKFKSDMTPIIGDMDIDIDI